ncbi:MAG: DUF4124 domain-containing protein [Proteobacteria bacterium]|nr:DUF4124 domain-containing protein [Pseudomonadota bacterium]MBS0495732.1 DUF4124 domain-containing protein [Pseudomonadota bacterium]
MKLHKLLLVTLACVWATGALAQWQWVDKDGRKVFSDRPPPADVPEKNILKQPHMGNKPRAPVAADAPTGTETPVTTQASASPGKDKQLEDNKAKAEAAEAAKKKAEEERVAKVRADNCARARLSKVQLAPGRLVASTNAKGERGFMDDATREAELRRADDIIAADCQ